jgi:hypothetical protein
MLHRFQHRNRKLFYVVCAHHQHINDLQRADSTVLSASAIGVPSVVFRVRLPRQLGDG